ncbi:MAG: glycosyltransferase family 2 protein, partial [Panacagrimonas sp.]
MATILLLLLSVPVWLVAVYLLLLTLLSGRPSIPPRASQRPRFVVVVPAHDEAAGIARTVESLLALDWPADARRVCVVADNCSDRTAAIAREAGAEVFERHDVERRGKGYALEFAFARLLEPGGFDAVVVVDADTAVSLDLLKAFAARLERGAQACQAFYGVLNPMASWRTRLITIALAIFHRLRGRGREALGLSCGLRGNGMCFTQDTLVRVPHRAFSIVEDLEYGLLLGRAGIRVEYVDEAHVLGEMVSSAKSARSQRQRWEGGRAQMVSRYGWPILREAVRRKDRVLFDLALDVLIPPLGTIAGAAIGLALLGA